MIKFLMEVGLMGHFRAIIVYGNISI